MGDWFSDYESWQQGKHPPGGGEQAIAELLEYLEYFPLLVANNDGSYELMDFEPPEDYGEHKAT